MSENAERYIKSRKRELIACYVDSEISFQSKQPDCIFMAGSPGAGKTEVSKSLIENIKPESDRNYIRIDADEIRNFFPKYNKKNSYLFQHAASKGVYMILDHVLHKKYNFILDGTFSSEKVARENIERCIKKNYAINIFYVYQDPLVAWSFVKKREKVEGRPIPKRSFIDAYFNSRNNVNLIKKEYSKSIVLYLIEQNIENKLKRFIFNINSIDDHIKQKYTKDSLQRMIK